MDTQHRRRFKRELVQRMRRNGRSVINLMKDDPALANRLESWWAKLGPRLERWEARRWMRQWKLCDN